MKYYKTKTGRFLHVIQGEATPNEVGTFNAEVRRSQFYVINGGLSPQREETEPTTWTSRLRKVIGL